MDHTAEIVDTKSTTDDGVSILVRCCNDDTTDSWHTYYGISGATEKELTDWADKCLQDKTARHTAVLSGIDTVKALKGAKKTVSS